MFILKTNDEKLTVANFFGRKLLNKLTPATTLNTLKIVYRVAYDALAKGFRPRKPYVVLARPVTFPSRTPVKLT